MNYLAQKSSMRYLFAGFIGLLGFCKGVVAQAPAFDSGLVVAEGAIRPQLVSRQFSFTEGASVDRAGNIFFTDQPNNKIWEYTLGGELVLFMDSAGRSNGMYFDRGGRLVTCADEEEQLW